MRIYVKNNPAKFHPDPIWNDGALGILRRGCPNKNNKKSSDMRSVPDLKKSTELLTNNWTHYEKQQQQ